MKETQRQRGTEKLLDDILRDDILALFEGDAPMDAIDVRTKLNKTRAKENEVSYDKAIRQLNILTAQGKLARNNDGTRGIPEFRRNLSQRAGT